MFPFFKHQNDTVLGTEAFPETTLKFSKNFFKIRRKFIFAKTFETIGKMLTGRLLVLWFLDSFLKIGLMLAHLKENGSSEEFTESLNLFCIQINSAK